MDPVTTRQSLWQRTARMLIIASAAVLGSLPLVATYTYFQPEYQQEMLEQKRKETARKHELGMLVENVLEKAEMEDGLRGISLHDMTTMAEALGYQQRLYDGDRVQLFVSQSNAGAHGIYLRARVPDNSLDRDWRWGSAVPVSEQKARAYAYGHP
ncbi:MAG: hypothetical protein ACOCWQ_01060 [Nanoarchaeota archaeon]